MDNARLEEAVPWGSQRREVPFDPSKQTQSFEGSSARNAMKTVLKRRYSCSNALFADYTLTCLALGIQRTKYEIGGIRGPLAYKVRLLVSTPHEAYLNLNTHWKIGERARCHIYERMWRGNELFSSTLQVYCWHT